MNLMIKAKVKRRISFWKSGEAIVEGKVISITDGGHIIFADDCGRIEWADIEDVIKRWWCTDEEFKEWLKKGDSN